MSSFDRMRLTTPITKAHHQRTWQPEVHAMHVANAWPASGKLWFLLNVAGLDCLIKDEPAGTSTEHAQAGRGATEQAAHVKPARVGQA